jgi:RNA polymerase sigma-70 factor (ECF subfamily)
LRQRSSSRIQNPKRFPSRPLSSVSCDDRALCAREERLLLSFPSAQTIRMSQRGGIWIPGIKRREEQSLVTNKLARFEDIVLPHLDPAYNLARWLVRNEDDAQDRVQDACLRAFQFFDGFHGLNPRAWFLTIVRNSCYTLLEQNRIRQKTTEFDEELHTIEDGLDPSALALKSGEVELLQQSLQELPAQYREIIVLRDLEEFSYKEIAEVINIPLGTVMSRLARARERLKRILRDRLKENP